MHINNTLIQSTEVTVITTLLIGNHDAKANERALRSTSPERRPLGDDGVSNLRVAAILSHRPEIFSIARSFYDSPGAPWSPYPLCPMDNPATERKIKSWAQRCSLEGRERRETNGVRKQKEREGGGKSEKRERERESARRARRGTGRAERRAALEGRVRETEKG